MLPRAAGYSVAIKLAADNNISISASSTPDVRMFTNNTNDFRTLRRLLEESKIVYNTFSLPEERQLKVVMRGVPETLTEEEIADDLRTQGYKFKSVHRMKNRSKVFPNERSWETIVSMQRNS